MNEKAQEFSTFRLLIAMILGLVMLSFIMSNLQYFEQQKINSSQTILKNKIESGFSAAGTGKKIIAEKLYFPKGMKITTRQLQEITKENKECFTLKSNNKNIKEEHNQIEFISSMIIDVSIKCNITTKEECKIADCNVTFG